MSSSSAAAALPPPRRPSGFADPRDAAKVAGWLCFFFAIVSVPVVIAMWPVATPQPKPVLRNFASALGYVGVSMIGALFVLGARFPKATAQFGVDAVFHFHRWFALLSVPVILAHIVIVAALGEVQSFNPLVARGSLTAGGIALLVFVFLAAWSLLRRRLTQYKDRANPRTRHWPSEYDHWRRGHALLAPAAYLLLLWHVLAKAPSLHGAPRWLAWTAFAVLPIGLVIWVRFVRPTHRVNRRWVVESVRQEAAPGACTVRLKAKGRKPLCFMPGQFIWMTMRDSPYMMREHPFSIASATGPRGTTAIELTIDTTRGDFTHTVADLKKDEVVWIDGPHGRFTTHKRPQADAYVLIAGGIGIAPIMSILRSAAAEPAVTVEGRPMGDWPYVLFYFTKASRPALFGEELEALKGRLELTVVHVRTREGSDKDKHITPEFVRTHLPDCTRKRYEFFLCGPPGLMDPAERALLGAGVPGSRIHEELYDWV